MKKRLRKKKHRGEFTEWGRRLVIRRNRKDEFEEFLDAFISMMEANDCLCGGSGDEDSLEVIVELCRSADDRDAKLKSITAWLEVRPDVQSWKVGEEFDLWHGKGEEDADEIDQSPPSGSR